MNEAVRLFFAVSALILVAMLSTPMDGLQTTPPMDPVRKIASVSQGKTVKAKAQKVSRKDIAVKKIARRG